MSELVCAFGLPWDLHLNGAGCLFCQAEADRLEVEFWDAVARGEFDSDGYRPNEKLGIVSSSGRVPATYRKTKDR